MDDASPSAAQSPDVQESRPSFNKPASDASPRNYRRHSPLSSRSPTPSLGVQKLQDNLSEVEYEAELLLLARKELIESDKARNGNREALSAVRKLARTSQSSVLVPHKLKELEGGGCRTCGDYGEDDHVWFLCSGGDPFVSLSFHQAHVKLEKDQEELEVCVKKLQSKIKDKALSISDKGAIGDKIGPSLMKALVTLKDAS